MLHRRKYQLPVTIPRNSGLKRALFNSQATVFASANALRHVWSAGLFRFGSQRHPALLAVRRNQRYRPAGIERGSHKTLHEIRFPDAGTAADIQELVRTRQHVPVHRFVLLKPKCRQLRRHLLTLEPGIVTDPRQSVIVNAQLGRRLVLGLADKRLLSCPFRRFTPSMMACSSAMIARVVIIS